MGRGVPAASVAVLVVALVSSGCVAGPTGPSPTDPLPPTTTTTLATTTTTVTIEEGLANYRACLGDAGVNIGEISLDGLGRPRMAEAFSRVDLGDRAVLDALERCGHHLSSGALDLGADPELRDLVQISLEEFTRCMRLRGVADYPDPVSDFDGLGSPFPVDLIPWDDPDLSRAAAACSEHVR